MDNFVKLPDRKIIKVRNEVDRYGFSYLLAKKVGLKRPPKSFAAWQHGWFFWDTKTLEDVGYDAASRDMPIVVGVKRQKIMLENFGFKYIYVGGLPFAYTKSTELVRKKDSLIAFIPHTVSWYKDYKINTDFLDYLYSIKNDFKNVCVCVFSRDAERESLVSEIDKRGLSIIIGARADDANSLIRMRNIFEQFEYVISSGMGSHLLYAAYCGCKTSITGPFSDYFPNPSEYKSPEYLDRIQHGSSNPVNRLKYPWLFVDHPRNSVTMVNWARSEIGEQSILDNDTIIKALGWSAIGYAKGVLRGAKRRLLAR